MSKIAKYAFNKAREKATEKWKASRVKDDMFAYVVPGVVAFAATQVAMNMGERALGKKITSPFLRLGLGAVVGAGVYALGSYVKPFKKWHQVALAGAGIAIAMEAVKRFAPPLLPVVGLPALTQGQSATGEYADLADDYSAPVSRGSALMSIPTAKKSAEMVEEVMADEQIPQEWAGSWGAIEDADLN